MLTLTHLPLKYFNEIIHIQNSDQWLKYFLWDYFQINIIGLCWCKVNIGSGNGLVISRQQMNTWANVDKDLYYHMASLG